MSQAMWAMILILGPESKFSIQTLQRKPKDNLIFAERRCLLERIFLNALFRVI